MSENCYTIYAMNNNNNNNNTDNDTIVSREAFLASCKQKNLQAVELPVGREKGATVSPYSAHVWAIGLSWAEIKEAKSLFLKFLPVRVETVYHVDRNGNRGRKASVIHVASSGDDADKYVRVSASPQEGDVYLADILFRPASKEAAAGTILGDIFSQYGI
jgi:hypothetical protein